MKSQLLDQITQRLLPSKIISQYVALKHTSSSQFVGLCPFHNEKTPSFHVSDDKKIFHCFGCGKGGNVVNFVSEYQNIPFKEALLLLAKEAGIDMPVFSKKNHIDEQIESIYEITTQHYQNELNGIHGKAALQYLDARGITKESINKFRLGFAPKTDLNLANLLTKHDKKYIKDSNVFFLDEKSGRDYPAFRERLMFPIFNIENKVVAFGGRLLTESSKYPKYINSHENPCFKKSEMLFGMNFAKQAIRKNKCAIIVEGYLDVITLHQNGFENSVAPLGTALKPQQLEISWNYTDKIILVLDSDTAGKAAAIKTALSALPLITPKKQLYCLDLKIAKDPDEYIKKYGAQNFANLLATAIPLSEFVLIYILQENNAYSKVAEDIARAKKALEELLHHVHDPILKKEFKSFFDNQMYLLNRNNFKSNKKLQNVTCSNAVKNVIAGNHSLEAQILYYAMKYPQLLEDEYIHDEISRVDFKEDIDLTKLNFANLSDTDRIEWERDLKRLEINFIKPLDMDSKNLEEIKFYVIRLFKMYRLDRISKEIEKILLEIADKGSEAEFARFSSLKKIEENLKLELGVL